MVKAVHPGVFWREQLVRAGVTQAWVARQAGISTKHLSQILTRKILPSARTTVKFARVVDADPMMLHLRTAAYEVVSELSRLEEQSPGEGDDS